MSWHRFAQGQGAGQGPCLEVLHVIVLACSRSRSYPRTLLESHVCHGPGLLKGKGLANDHDWKLCVSWCRFIQGQGAGQDHDWKLYVSWCRFTQEQGAVKEPCLEFECLIPLIVTLEIRGYHMLKPSCNFTNTVAHSQSFAFCLMGGGTSGKMFFPTTSISFPEAISQSVSHDCKSKVFSAP